MALDLVEVHGQFLRADRTPLTGAVIFSPCVAAPLDSGPPDNSSAVIAAVPVTCLLDDDGRFSVLLVPSDDTGWRTDGACPLYYECDIRVSGLRNTYHVAVPAPGPWDLTDLLVLESPPNVATVPTPGAPGPPGPPGTGGAGYATDLGAVAAGVPVTVTHGLSTTDVDVQIILKNSPGSGPGPGHEVEADASVIDLDQISVTFSGDEVPAAAGMFRVSVRALGESLAV